MATDVSYFEVQGDSTLYQFNDPDAESAIFTLNQRLQTAEGNITTLQGDVSTAQDDISTLQGDVDDVQTEVSELRADVQFKTYDSVEDLGLTSGSATITDVWDALPTSSMLIQNAAAFAASELPATYGCVVIVKSVSATNGFISFREKGGSGDYNMGINSSNEPTGTWLLMSAYEAGTVTITNGSKDSAFPTRATKSGAVVNLQGLTSGSNVSTSWAKLGQIGGNNLWPSQDTTGVCLAGYTPIQIRVLTTGEIQIRGSSALSNQVVRYNLTWIV